MNTILEERWRPKLGSTYAKVYMVAITVFLLVALQFIYLHAAYSVALNSDSVNALLQGYTVSHGNFTLDGWTLSNISFYTTDLLYYAFLTWIGGFHFSILKFGPSLIYTAIVLLSVLLATKGKSHPLLRIGAVVLLIGFPVQDLAAVVFSPMDHTNTLMLALCALVLVALHSKIPKVSYVMVPGFLAYASYGDTLTLFIGAIPIAIASLVKRQWIMAGLSAMAAIVGHETATHIHGFNLYPTFFRFAQLSNLPHHFSYAIHGILSLTGADFFNHKVDLQSVLFLLHIVGTIALVNITYTAVRRWKELDYVSLILLLGMTISMFAFVFSTFPVADSSDRYLLSFSVLGSILVARQFEWLTFVNSMTKKTKLASVSVMALVYLVSFFGFHTAYPNQPQRDVVNFLEEHNLTNGYGSYWNASILTAVSNGAIKVSPVYMPNHKVAEYDWESNKAWYKQPANFLVFDGSMGFNMQDVVAIFGKDSATYHVGKYTIAKWNRNITPQLNHVPMTGGIAWG